MTNDSLRQELLTEDITKLMWKLTPIAIISMSINSINYFADALFIGQFLGETSVAAIALAFPIAIITNGFAAMIGVGSSSILSRAIGSNDTQTLKKMFGTNFLLSLITATILTVAGWNLADELIGFMGGTGEVLDLAVKYYRVVILGSIFQIFGVGVNMLIRAEGKVNEAMTYAITSTLINIILNPIFIGYFEMGIEGAAYATIISMFVFTILNAVYFIKKRASYQVDLSFFNLEKSIVQPLLAIGISAMMLQIMFVLQQIVVYKSLDYYGGSERDIAFMGAVIRVRLLLLLPGFGFSVAMQPVVGVNYGAEIYSRVKETFWTFLKGSTLLFLVLWLLVMIFPETIIGWLLPNTVLTGEELYNYRLMLVTTPLSPFFLTSLVLYQSIGDAKTSGIIMVVRELIFYIPFVALLPIWWGISGIYGASFFQNIIIFCILAVMIYKKFVEIEKKELMVNPK